MDTTRLAWLLLELVALAFPFAETLSCYDCDVDGGPTACTQPLKPPQTSPCQGVVCLIIWSDYGRQQGYSTSLTCLTNEFGYMYTGPFTVEQCLLLNSIPTPYDFYIYNNMCCFTTFETQNSGGSTMQYNRTTCGCDTDYCNGNATAFKPPGYKTPEYTTKSTNTTSMASFVQSRQRNQYISGFAVIVTNFIVVALSVGLLSKI